MFTINKSNCHSHND